jgi:3D (Asp-Asp-Asp) domain-containing protein
MTLHVSSKLFVIVLVVAALVTAFRAPTKPVSLMAFASVTLADRVNVSINPTVSVVPAVPLELPAVTAEVTPAQPLETPVATAEILEEAPAATEVAINGLPTFTLRATAYNSEEGQTDATPFITATGATTAFGIIAASRDMLEHIPYGSLVRLKDMGNYRSGRGEGKYQELLDTQGLFIVEDTMHPRKLEQIDVWFPHRSEALTWGVRKVELEVVRVGRDGPMLEEPIIVAGQ